MILAVNRSDIKGRVRIPGSKSHTIRAVFFAGLADGWSEIRKPLYSDDTRSALRTCAAFGAEIETSPDAFRIKGVGGTPDIPCDVVDVGNSGTTLRFAVGVAGLCRGGWTILTGDSQIRKRPLGPLLDAVRSLGAESFSAKQNGMAPAVIKGRMTGGTACIDAVTSQFLSSLLICTPLLENDTHLEITRLNEVPYAEMTLRWLDRLGIAYRNDRFKVIEVKGGQKYAPLCTTIPGDFSSATFFAVLAAISGGSVTIDNLDMSDSQGDKAIFGYLADMGTKVMHDAAAGSVTVQGRELRGIDIDINATPDALPAMAVAACFAEGRTRLLNCPQARLKETDRINVMRIELEKMGADIKELPDGLEIRHSRLNATEVSGHGDHRVVMALATAGLCISGETTVDTAEAVNVTFPQFVELVRVCGGNIELRKLQRG